MVDIRWIQRFSNYKKALKNLEDAVELMREKELSFLEKQGSVQAFEYTYELAWKVLKDFLASRGKTGMYGPKDIAKKALALELIDDGEVWMQMIISRKLTSQTYD